jgi:uncharacterized protein YlxW (UPF0749 family)
MTWLLVAIVFLVVVLAVWQTVQLQQIRRTVDAVPADGNVFTTLGALQQRTDDLDRLVRRLDPRVDNLERRMPLAISRSGVVAYNAFGNITGQMSRSIALVNDRGDGIVVTILASREETLFFTKEVRLGRGSEQLSPEEQTAVDRAMAAHP